MIEGVLRFSLNFYEKVGYWGLILISLSFEGIKGGILTSSTRSPDPFERPLGSSDFDDSITLERKITVRELSERFDEIVKDLFNEFLSEAINIGFSNPVEKAQHDKLVALMGGEHARTAEETPRGENGRDNELYERQIKMVDAQIDGLVYDLYGLTEEEIGIVEESL
jgi:hypothetical protein